MAANASRQGRAHGIVGRVSPGNDSEAKPDNVTALSQYRARLARGQRARRSDEIFATPDPPATIRALPRDEFYYLVHEVGFPEAMDILALGTAEQVQTVLDFSIWDRDRIAADKSDDWLATLVEVPVETLGSWAQGIDVELLALLVRKRARIYDLSLEEAPEPPEGVLWNSPDRLFTIDILGEPDQARVTQRLLDGLYRHSPATMRRLLVGMRAESDAELEEEALRWRSGRMADLGFVDYFEALAVYQEIDPASVRLGANPPPRLRPSDGLTGDDYLRLPAVMAERLSGRTPFARGVGQLRSRDESSELHFHLVGLCNRVLSADRVAPDDDAAIRIALERVCATLDLAVELLARGDAEREGAAVREVPLLTLHRLGTSLVGKLRRLALALRQRNPFAALAPALDIFTHDDSQVLRALTRVRPAFPGLLDNPPSAGERPFASLADLASATHAVERAAAAIELVRSLGIEAAHVAPQALAALALDAGREADHPGFDPASIDTDVLGRTVLVARLLGLRSPPLVALSKEAIDKFKLNFNNTRQSAEHMGHIAFDILQASTPDGHLEGAAMEVAARWVTSLAPLAPVLGANPLP